MTKPNLFFIDGIGYSIHTYAKEKGVSVGVSSKRLRKMARLGECKFSRRNNVNWMHVDLEWWNGFMLELRRLFLENMDEE